MYKMLDLGGERFVEIQVDDGQLASVALLRGADAVCLHLEAAQLDEVLAALTLARASMRFFPPGTASASPVPPRKRR